MNAKALRILLSGGDRRSIARSKDALHRIESNSDLVQQLAELTADKDWLVAMRALDLLEKLAQSHRDWVEPHKRIHRSLGR